MTLIATLQSFCSAEQILLASHGPEIIPPPNMLVEREDMLRKVGKINDKTARVFSPICDQS